tara:strand:- start:751 stop:2865 length:2115 start_codon:yes stop_codon:yes gene_type:complete
MGFGDDREGKALVIDNGSQYGKRYFKALRDLGVAIDYFNAGVRKTDDGELIRPEITLEMTDGYPLGFIIGGKSSVTGSEEMRPDVDPRISSDFGGVLVGTCYGMQEIADRRGGEVRDGFTQCGPVYSTVDLDVPFFQGLGDLEPSFIPPDWRFKPDYSFGRSIRTRTNSTHNDGVTRVPDGFQVMACSVNELDNHTHIDGMWKPADRRKNNFVFATQYHPETYLTEFGDSMLENAIELSGIPRKEGKDRQGLHRDAIEDELSKRVREIRDTVKDSDVFLPLSGGIDSSVTHALFREAGIVPYAFHIRMPGERYEESQELMEKFRQMGWDNVELLDRVDFFENYSLKEEDLREDLQGKGFGNVKLKDAWYSEHKRFLVQEAYEQVQLDYMESKKLNFDNSFAAAGTNRADIEESSGIGDEFGSKDNVKTHHNVGRTSNEYRKRGRLIEPMQDLYKQDIYVAGELLGLTDVLGVRKPFPGPGFLVRHSNFDRVEHGDLSPWDIFQLSKRANDFSLLHGVHTFVTPLESMGVCGDERVVGVMAMLQMADGSEPDGNFEKLRFVAGQLPHYTSLSKTQCLTHFYAPLIPFDTTMSFERTPTKHTYKDFEPLRQFDHYINGMVDRHDIPMTQVVNTLVPFGCGDPTKVSCGFRGWQAPDLMTGYSLIPDGKEMPVEVIGEMREAATHIFGLANPMLTIGYKPCSSTEPN